MNEFIIAGAASRKSTSWVNSSVTWEEFTKTLSNPIRTPESYKAYLSMPKSEQNELKDVGGFVGGKLSGSRRLNSSVVSRTLITLDLDNMELGDDKKVIEILDSLGFRYCTYSTRKHCERYPRLRVIFPLEEELSSDEYEPACRAIAENFGLMKYADPTTFEVARLMFYPSASSNGDFLFKQGEGVCINGTKVLDDFYDDWRDVSKWPSIPGHEVKRITSISKQQNPLEKKGIVGAFCRCYDIHHAISHFLPNLYTEAGADRYTYIGGSTYGGAVVYDDNFLYSHHATDVCSGELVNSFDLVRLHRFGELDEDSKPDTPINRLPSYLAMCELASSDDLVKVEVVRERAVDLDKVFDSSDVDDVDDDRWLQNLDVSRKGEVVNSLSNLILILRNDKNLKGKVALDEFANMGMVLGSLAWDKNTDQRMWSDVDDASLHLYLESTYGITPQDNKIEKVLAIVSHENRYNSVKDYLLSLEWDGVDRISSLFTDYLGAEPSAYASEVAIKTLAAAVGRAIDGGVKWDYMPILYGAQGIGKSTFLRILGRNWFSDSLTNFEGKEASEMIQGTWINELGELTVLNRSETNAVKQFLSKQDDIYRVPYGKRTERFPRRCVFFGTTNNSGFLKDVTGNRRFWPIDCGIVEPSKSIFDDLEKEVDQVWAQAVELYLDKEPLHLSKGVLPMSVEKQEVHRDVDSREGIVIEYLDTPVPINWYDMDIDVRLQYLAGRLECGDVETFVRDEISTIEIFVEAFNQSRDRMKRKDSYEINAILDALPNWTRTDKRVRLGKFYGQQRVFKRIKGQV